MQAFVYYLKQVRESFSTKKVERHEKEYDPDTVGKFSHYSYLEDVRFCDHTFDVYSIRFDDVDDGAEAFFLANQQSIIDFADRYVRFHTAVHFVYNVNGTNAVCLISYFPQAKGIKKVGEITVSIEVPQKKE